MTAASLSYARLAGTPEGSPAGSEASAKQKSSRGAADPHLDASVGRSFFSTPWIQAPSSTTARDGLGPLFNAHACTSCHPSGGRGRLDAKTRAAPTALILRLSLPGTNPVAGAVPEPAYGDQIQTRGVMSRPGAANVRGAGEATVEIDYQVTRGAFTDGEPFELRRPQARLTNLAYGPVNPDAHFSFRPAPALRGAGLLDAVPEAEIIEYADPEDRNGDGISGRPNRVWDRQNEVAALGRFGWKASQPSLRQQVASAFRNDVGITNELFRDQPCTPTQQDCVAMPSGADPKTGVEIEARLFEPVVSMTRFLPAPKPKLDAGSLADRGRALFAAAGCDACHRPLLHTGGDGAPDELAKQPIEPYTDLLLHDMGPGLADGRADFEADGTEWRTAPLWGIGASKPPLNGYLHDGRARSIVEAILWHGGEAANAHERFVAFSRQDREALVAFIESR